MKEDADLKDVGYYIELNLLQTQELQRYYRQATSLDLGIYGKTGQIRQN
jgi:hypothetical protein